MSRLDLFAVTQAMQKIEDENSDYKSNLTWLKLKKIRCELELEIAIQRYEYLTKSYCGDKFEKYYKEVAGCEKIIHRNTEELNNLREEI